MAKVIDNIFVRGLSGKLGDQFVIRNLRDGRTIVCAKPDFSNRKLSRDQKEHHKRFKEASAYAKRAARSQPIYAQLAEGMMKNAYNVALGDWFNPPVIQRVGRYGAAVRVWVTDDVHVAGVQVLVLDEEGVIREKGDATQGRGDWWEYMPTADGKIVVEARDLPGNRVKAELVS
ncbi:MAG TPA: hypothetical protein VN843_30390 [Anaerolineales bacterium]|nr:hypothetical protein [Anaerolineales bacterium]